MSDNLHPETDREALRLIVDLAAPRLFLSPPYPAEVLKRVLNLASYRLCSFDTAITTQISLMHYLIELAEKTEGSGVWRALFAEIAARLKGQLDLEDLT